MLKYALPEYNKQIKISTQEARKLLENNKAVILDIRMPDEEDVLKHDFVLRLDPLKLEEHHIHLPKDKTILVVCNTQNRSPFAALYLREKGYDAKYIEKGIKELEKEFQKDVIKYENC
ncbi:thiamine biosynthesis protein ThiI [Nautilia profundicola AmH]|uniref:Thiamine biosynthesis protein ThiI n=1 Tax=Nautilia profundicola (strain ATCC BAA-1463 / DSM 18972 / AmH) TaxID=598659 RepID=B9L842_NAUPA|nr:rhodanese-like domain-containing protein [Nautilia profundicola]ACM92573.1 thiamine biosynthesis protein ThiI [Nautilia profundicola AmH]